MLLKPEGIDVACRDQTERWLVNLSTLHSELSEDDPFGCYLVELVMLHLLEKEAALDQHHQSAIVREMAN